MEVAGSLLWFSSNDVVGMFFAVVGNEGEVYGDNDFFAECSFVFCRCEDLLVELAEHECSFFSAYLLESEENCVAVWCFAVCFGLVGASEPLC